MIEKSLCESKFELLFPFMEEVCRAIKKEIKQEFVQKGFFRSRSDCQDWKGISLFFYKKITEERDEKIIEWLSSTWICKHGEIFQLFHEELGKLNTQYDSLKEFPAEFEASLKKISQEKFGSLQVYVFSIFNSVVFSEKVYNEIREGALKELSLEKEEKNSSALSLDELQKQFEEEKQKLCEKYEKRLQGTIKKYQLEVEGYRKQIGLLQKKIEGARV